MSDNPAEVLRTIAEKIAEPLNLGVDHPAFDKLALYCSEPIQRSQDCARGEHLYVTGRRTCPLCGSDL